MRTPLTNEQVDQVLDENVRPRAAVEELKERLDSGWRQHAELFNGYQALVEAAREHVCAPDWLDPYLRQALQAIEGGSQ